MGVYAQMIKPTHTDKQIVKKMGFTIRMQHKSMTDKTKERIINFVLTVLTLSVIAILVGFVIAVSIILMR